MSRTCAQSLACVFAAWLGLQAVPPGAAGEGQAPRLFPGLQFAQDYVPGTKDPNGQWMGGTETMRLLAYGGKLYASLGYWTDVPYGQAKGDEPWTGAQVLVKEAAEGPWRVEVGFGPAYLRTEMLASVTLTTDARGTALGKPVQMLLAGPSDFTPGGPRWATVWSRDDQTGQWTKSQVAREPRQAGVRALGSHVDKATRIHHLFAGVSQGEIYRGAYDPETPGRLRWDAKPELTGTGRIMCFAECNGELYAAAGLEERASDKSLAGGLYRRADGPQPKWELVYQWPYTPQVKGDEANIMRGLTAVPDPKGGAQQVLAGTRAHPGVVELIDPLKNYAVTKELDIKACFATAWGLAEYRGPALSAYNRFVPFSHPDAGEQVWFISLWVNHPERRQPPHNGAHFLVRHRDGTYEYGTVYDPAHPLPPGKSLRATRTIEVSPFPEDHGRVLYFGGYDCAGQDSHNTAWIYKATLSPPRAGAGPK